MKSFTFQVTWDRLIQPTIQLLTNGFFFIYFIYLKSHLGVPVSTHMNIALQEYAFWIVNEPTMKEFVNPKTGDVYQTGDQVKRFVK